MIRRRRWQPSRSPGRSRISRKAIAQGRPDDPPVPVVLPRAFFLHADHGCGGHPVFPAPSVFSRAACLQNLGHFVPRERRIASHSTVIAKSAATKLITNSALRVVQANAGTHSHRQTLFNRAGTPAASHNASRWLWVLAFARATREMARSALSVTRHEVVVADFRDLKPLIAIARK